jgi:hypothetical protein
MPDIVDAIHYLIGFLFVALFLLIIIQTHNYFSKNNKTIEEIQSMYAK